VRTFGKIWNECNEYEIPKNTLKQCEQFFHFNKDFLKDMKWLKNDVFMRNVLCTHLDYNILQHLFGS
jgi:hypothetical protein